LRRALTRRPLLPFRAGQSPREPSCQGEDFPQAPRARAVCPCLRGRQSRLSGFEIPRTRFHHYGLEAVLSRREPQGMSLSPLFQALRLHPVEATGLLPTPIQREWVFTPETAPGHHRTGPSRGIRRQGSDTRRVVSPHLATAGKADALAVSSPTGRISVGGPAHNYQQWHPTVGRRRVDKHSSKRLHKRKSMAVNGHAGQIFLA
jgi:hypothetical protein